MERKKKIKQHREKKSLNIVQVYYLCQALCPLIRSLILSYMLRIDPFFFFRFSLLWLLSFGLLLCKLNEIKTMQPFCVFYLSKGKHTKKKGGHRGHLPHIRQEQQYLKKRINGKRI